jgi:hypothetical protein
VVCRQRRFHGELKRIGVVKGTDRRASGDQCFWWRVHPALRADLENDDEITCQCHFGHSARVRERGLSGPRAAYLLVCAARSRASCHLEPQERLKEVISQDRAFRQADRRETRRPFCEHALGACLSIPHEPRWFCKGADVRRAAGRGGFQGQAAQHRRRPLQSQPFGSGWIWLHSSLSPPHWDQTQRRRLRLD